MIEFRPFAPAHLDSLDLASLQPELQLRLSEPGLAPHLVQSGLSYSGFDGERCVGCAGLLPQWEGRALAWAIFGPIRWGDWLAVTRKVSSVLARGHRRGFRRIEAHVDANFPQAIRFAQLLGFEVEALMRRFGPTGRDSFLYVRLDDFAPARPALVAPGPSHRAARVEPGALARNK